MDLMSYQIDILKEVRGQILHQLFANNYSGLETRAYLDTVKIIDEKIEEINKYYRHINAFEEMNNE